MKNKKKPREGAGFEILIFCGFRRYMPRNHIKFNFCDKLNIKICKNTQFLIHICGTNHYFEITIFDNRIFDIRCKISTKLI